MSPETPRTSFLDHFVSGLSFQLDRFQDDAISIIDGGSSVLVAAPTGSGKTLVAEFGVARALEQGQRSFYTTPLKALSNQKYHDFVRAYGEEGVGLLTGDIALNGSAPIVVMTTEVLRNMIYANPEDLFDLGCVVLDEVHFLEDRYRGSVWEEIILSAPSNVTLICLSATVSNAEQFAAWIKSVRGETRSVIEERRPIELRHVYVYGDRTTRALALLPTFDENGKPNPAGLSLDKEIGRGRQRYGHTRSSPRGVFRPRRVEVVPLLDHEALLPAIYFIFSRAGCDDAVAQCLDAGIRLVSLDEREQIRAIADDHVEGLSDADLEVLGYRRFLSGLEHGVAAHHAGMVPPFREAVEDLFERSLLRVVFATETLALGINMPARTVVIESLSKFNGVGHEDLSPGEYTQLTGRAGRRGIDDLGFAAALHSPFHTFADVSSLASKRSRALRSSFRPTYNMVVNLVRRYERDDAHRLVRSSFAQFLSSRSLERELDAVVALLSERGYLLGWHLGEPGERLRGIYHDCDLLVSEAMGDGIFDDLESEELAALVALFVFEQRRQPVQSDRHLTARLAERVERLEELGRTLREDERVHKLPRTRTLDAGFSRLAFEWARGRELSEILYTRESSRRNERREPIMTGGDFVRTMKQLIDLLGQIAVVSTSTDLKSCARRAADELGRGIVAASSHPGPIETAG